MALLNPHKHGKMEIEAFLSWAEYDAWVAERQAVAAAKAKQIEAIAAEGMVGLQAGAEE